MCKWNKQVANKPGCNPRILGITRQDHLSESGSLNRKVIHPEVAAELSSGQQKQEEFTVVELQLKCQRFLQFLRFYNELNNEGRQTREVCALK